MTKKKSAYDLKNECLDHGFTEMIPTNYGIDEAEIGSTILVLCHNKSTSDMVYRTYYKLLSTQKINIKQAIEYGFLFYGGGRILILRATKKHDLSKFDKAKTYFRLNWRK